MHARIKINARVINVEQRGYSDWCMVITSGEVPIAEWCAGGGVTTLAFV